MTKCRLLLCYLSFIALWSPSGQAIPRPELDLSLKGRVFGDLSYFNTTANYDVNGGSYTSLGGGRYYRLISGGGGAEYWLTQDMSVLAQLSGARGESDDGTFKRTGSGLTEAQVGARYTLLKSSLCLVPELVLTYPFNEFTVDSDEVLTGEGVMSILFGAYADWPLGSFTPYGRAGFLYQDDGRASHAVFALGSQVILSSFNLAFEVYGSRVVIEDAESDNRVVRDTLTSRVNGGSWRYYSVNPEILGLNAELQWNLSDQWALSAAYDHTINGEAAAAGWQATVGLQFRFIDGTREFTPDTPDVLEQQTEERRAFEPDQPAYDQSVFNEPKPKIKPKPKTRSKPKTKPKRSTRKAPLKSTKPVDVDKALDEVQQSLEN